MSDLPILQPRTCGGCTQCCKNIGILELQKPPNQWCPHCAIGEGCKIYDTRPPGCQNFVCAWVASHDMPEDQRPDLTKVVVWLPTVYGGGVIIAAVDPARPDAARKGYLGRALRDAVRLGHVVVESVGDRRTFFGKNHSLIDLHQAQVVAHASEIAGSHDKEIDNEAARIMLEGLKSEPREVLE